MKKAILIIMSVSLVACMEIEMQEPPLSGLLGIAENRGWKTATMSRSEVNIVGSVPEFLFNGSVNEVVFLENNDRIVAARWVDSNSSPQAISAIRSMLFPRFSESTRDVIDELIQEPDSSPIEIIAFSDPSISPERIIIASIESTLYELHVQEMNIDEAMGLLSDIARLK